MMQAAMVTAVGTARGRVAPKREAGPRHAVPGQRPQVQATRRARARRYARRRLAVAGLLALATLGAGWWASSAVATGAPQEQPVRTTVVAEGETLWLYAGQIARPGEDVRDVVALLQRLNHLPSGMLQAGQVLRLPARR